MTPPPPPGKKPARRSPKPKGPPDHRINAYRGDIADIALKGRVDAGRFVSPAPHRLTGERSRMMWPKPDRSDPAVSELLPGQRFDVLHIDNGWAWGYSAHDHYVGYVVADDLSDDAPGRTHRITAPTALAFSRPDIKSEVAQVLPMNAELAAEVFDEHFYRTRRGVFISRLHAAEIDDFALDPVEIAGKFIGTPYKWGGRTRMGIDCSGLIQVALGACGIAAPRDSDLQETALGKRVEGDQYERGDLIFFPGHVGIMTDAKHILHANQHRMSTVIEPLDHVVHRLLPKYPQPITSAKRL